MRRLIGMFIGHVARVSVGPARAPVLPWTERRLRSWGGTRGVVPNRDFFGVVGDLNDAAVTVAEAAAVAAGSLAAGVEFRAGDEVVTFGGQPLISIADFSWLLHRAPAAAKLNVLVRRGGSDVALTLALPEGWRMKTEISKRVGTWSMRAMAFGGLTLVDLEDAARQARGIAADTLALFVKGVGQFNKHGTAKKAGFLKDDVIVDFAGISARATEGEMIGRVLAKTKIGETVDVTVLRGGERVVLKLPMQ